MLVVIISAKSRILGRLRLGKFGEELARDLLQNPRADFELPESLGGGYPWG
jgi:hypothetical protein